MRSCLCDCFSDVLHPHATCHPEARAHVTVQADNSACARGRRICSAALKGLPAPNQKWTAGPGSPTGPFLACWGRDALALRLMKFVAQALLPVCCQSINTSIAQNKSLNRYIHPEGRAGFLGLRFSDSLSSLYHLERARGSQTRTCEGKAD